MICNNPNTSNYDYYYYYDNYDYIFLTALIYNKIIYTCNILRKSCAFIITETYQSIIIILMTNSSTIHYLIFNVTVKEKFV